jgi:hypothetical protein
MGSAVMIAISIQEHICPRMAMSGFMADGLLISCKQELRFFDGFDGRRGDPGFHTFACPNSLPPVRSYDSFL